MRFIAPVRAGDTVTTSGIVSHARPMGAQLLYAAAVRAERQDAAVVAIGDAMGRVPIGPLRPETHTVQRAMVDLPGPDR
jgi:acyl dehydratase